MALDKSKTYMVYNYDTSQVAVTTRNGSVIIPAGADHAPSGLPFSFDDISYINMTTPAFKSGMLWFEPEYEDEIYAELRIVNPESILSNMDIEDIIINPTLEKIETLLSIEDPNYFNRCYGVYIGLRNEGVSMSGKITEIMNARYSEMSRGKRKTSIKVRPAQVSDADEVANKSEVEDLKRQIEEMKALLMQKSAAEEAEPAKPKKSSTSKKKTASEESTSTTE